MGYVTSSTSDKCARLRAALTQTGVMVPGAFNAFSAQLIEQAGFSIGYVTGAGLSNGATGYPDIGMLSFDEMARLAGYAARSVSIPVFADADDGYGDAWQVYRTVQTYEREGLAGLHIEDQQAPKRCGHLDGKQLIPPEAMIQKLLAACHARQNPDFVIIARTDARALEGMTGAIHRAQAYRSAGADMIFVEALTSQAEFIEFRNALPHIPLLANMTEFGKTPIFTQTQFANWGYQWVLYPMTSFRLMANAVQCGLQTLKAAGSQQALLDSMMTRQTLYDVLDYPDYTRQGEAWAADAERLGRESPHQTE